MAKSLSFVEFMLLMWGTEQHTIRWRSGLKPSFSPKPALLTKIQDAAAKWLEIQAHIPALSLPGSM